MLKIFQNNYLFFIINEYTNLLNFCSTYKNALQLKKQLNYALNLKKSLQFYNDLHFRNLALSKMLYSNK